MFLWTQSDTDFFKKISSYLLISTYAPEIISFTTKGSRSVEILLRGKASPAPIFLKIRHKIFPGRIVVKPSTIWIMSG